mmetsp:Transcript_15596/g.19018  ORF Transcript_15596/g.19018 Transcript_15596/m.19018 type:complete len:239 (-) Transcript_15596:204-920(-)
MRMSSSFPPLVIAGCSGAGKGTLIGKLQEWQPAAFGFSVSHTTRSARPGEENGIHYHFTDVETMKREIAAGAFLECAEVHGNYYGTSKAAVEKVQNEGKICILDIDVQGVQQVKRSSLKCKYLWIEVPTLEELEKRLRGRGTETEEKIQKRIRNAKNELEFAHPDSDQTPFDAFLINDKLDDTFSELQQLIFEWYPHLCGPSGGAHGGGPCATVSNLLSAVNPCATTNSQLYQPPSSN